MFIFNELIKSLNSRIWKLKNRKIFNENAVSHRDTFLAHVELYALVDVIAVANPPANVGQLGIEAVADIAVNFEGFGRVSGKATFEKLKLTDKTGTLGLPQVALDNISQLGKGLVEKLVNDQLKNGLPLSLPGNLPIKICNPMVNIYDRYLYIQSDFTIDPSLLTIGSGGSCPACARPCA